MDTLYIILLIVLLIRWLILSRRMKELESRISDAGANMASSGELAALVRRIYKLEVEVKGLLAARSAVVVEAPAVVEEPVVEPSSEPEPAAPLRSLCEFCGRTLPALPAICECRTAAKEEESAPVLPPPRPAIEVAAPAFATPAPKRKIAGEEWEAIVGGNWLNKLGVFVLVVGIALFLGYSFTGMNQAGRAATGVAVSLVMLGGGVYLERRDRYRIIGTGLLGGGWAALYFTTYAMHALEAAKVIVSPLVGEILLLAVAAGMILHSLRYRSQAVTGLAYFVAFATLAITPVTAFSVMALIPLAGSLLYLSHRFEWSEMALLGLVATYGTYASNNDPSATLLSTQVLLAVYWLLFEGFDLLRARKLAQYRSWESALLPLNALGFAALSWAKWAHDAPELLYALAAGIAVAYLVSTILRTKLCPPSSFTPVDNTLTRVLSGGFEGSLTFSATFAALAVFLKLHGGEIELGLFAEAELLLLAGLVFRQPYPRQLAAALFAVAVGKLLGFDVPSGGEMLTVGGWAIKHWTPLAALAGALFYFNRMLRGSGKAYGYAASAMFAWLLGYEMPGEYLAIAWFAYSAGLFALGWVRRLEDFRMQGYGVGVLAYIATGDHQLNIAAGAIPESRHAWLSLAGAAMASYAGVVCSLRSGADRMHEREGSWVRRAGSWATSAALSALVWRVMSPDYVGVGWFALALLLLELGLRKIPEQFERQSMVVTVQGSIYVLLANVMWIHNDGPLRTRMIPVIAAGFAYLYAGRVFAARKGGLAVDLSSAMGSFFLLFGLWALMPIGMVAPAWALVSMLLIETGFRFDLPSLRLQGHLSSGAAFGRLFFANFTGLGATGAISHRLLTVVPVLGSHYYQWSRQRANASRPQPWEANLGRAYLYAAAIGMLALLHFELDPAHVAAGWAATMLAFLILGQRWKERDLRWQSYAIAVLTFGRSVMGEDASGAVERILFGAVVIACFFAAQQFSDRTGVERYSRLLFSGLATLLLTLLLYREVTGGVLTVAWGLEAVCLLAAGFPLRDRILRLSGLTLFLVCILKLFLYDLRELETGYRILSFIALGIILMGVSWVYTRFRDRIQQFL